MAWRSKLPRMTCAGLLLCAATATASRPAQAQSMDYGALESLFGEPVTTSVTGTPQRASEVPATMVIITQDEIRRSGARDLPGVLRHVPGLDVLRWAMDDADVSVRGYNQAYAARLLVLVDGRQVYADHYGYTPWSTIPIELSEIRQIEIVMGPNSALFGFNAVGGVINIITYDPLYNDVNTVSAEGGTQGLVQGSAVATLRSGDKAGLRLSLGGYRNDDFSTPLGVLDRGVRRGNSRLAFDALGHVRLGDDVDASLELTHSEITLPEITPGVTLYYNDIRRNSIKATISADTEIGVLQLSAYGNWFRESSQAPNIPIPSFAVSNDVYVARLRDFFKLSTNHIFRISVEYRHNEMGSIPIVGAHAFYDVLSGDAMWNWIISESISLTNAMRVDHLMLGRSGVIPPGYLLTNADWNRRSRTEISFNSGIVWKPDGESTLRVTAARGVQLPNLFDLGAMLAPDPPSGYDSGIPTIKPTVVTNYELSWEQQLPAWNAQLHLRVFHQTTTDVTANNGGSDPALNLVSTPTNIGDSRATGLEMLLSGTFGDIWRWGLAYTPEWIHDHFRPGFNAETVFVDYTHTHPVHVVNANLGWASGPWEIDGYLRYESEFDCIRGLSPSINGSGSPSSVATLIRIPNYVSVDARIAYQLTDHVTLSLSGQNLLDSPQRQTSAAAVERIVFAGASIHF